MSKKNKIEKHIQQTELPDFLRTIADILENKSSERDKNLDFIKDFKKFKINIHNEHGHTSVKMEVKPRQAQVPDAPALNSVHTDAHKPEYSDLKKRMQCSFKTIFKTIHAGNMPPVKAVEDFLADSKLMVTYGGYGDEYYNDYICACETFRQAIESGEVEEAHKACDLLNNIKAHCHAHYK